MKFPQETELAGRGIVGASVFFLSLLIFRLASWCFGTVLSAYVTKKVWEFSPAHILSDDG